VGQVANLPGQIGNLPGQIGNLPHDITFLRLIICAYLVVTALGVNNRSSHDTGFGPIHKGMLIAGVARFFGGT